MKIAGISDIHGLWAERVETKDGKVHWPSRITYPPADVLVFAGDVLGNYWGDKYDSELQMAELARLNEFLGTKIADGTYKHVIFVAGNHDWCFQKRPESKDILTNAHYLQDSGVEIEGVKFWGSPWQPWFWDWAFNFPDHNDNFFRARAHARATWGMIPDDTDVLITHGPPLGILDETFQGMGVGCQFLRERIHDLSLKLHVFGHIHYSYGTKVMGGFGPTTTFMNAAACDEEYQPTNPIQIVEIDGTS
jgi:Icc-related predicted phosphoesterase